MTVQQALVSGNREQFRRLLGETQDVDALDGHGWTLLNWAAGRGDIESMEMLIGRGADPVKVGRDNRTPYLIAFAAGHSDAAKYLRAKEAERGGDSQCVSSRQGEARLFCKGYQMAELRRFSGWPAKSGADLADDAIVFVHQDYSVTESVLDGQQLLLEGTGTDWVDFCRESLKFVVPTDFELLVAS